MSNLSSFKDIFLNIPKGIEENYYKKEFENKRSLLFETIVNYISQLKPQLLLQNEKNKIHFKYEYLHLSNEFLFELDISNLMKVHRVVKLKENLEKEHVYQYLIKEKDIFSNYELFMIKNLITEELNKLNVEKDIENINHVIQSTYSDLIANEKQSIHFDRDIPLLKKPYQVIPKLDFQTYGLYIRIEIDNTFITKRIYYNDYYFSLNQDVDLFESLFIKEFNKLKYEYYQLILKKIHHKIKSMNNDNIEPIRFIEYKEFNDKIETYQIKERFNEKVLYANIFIDYQEYLRLRKKLYKYRDSYFTLTLNKEEMYNIKNKEMSLYIDKNEYNYLHKKTKFKRKKIKTRKD